MQKVNVGLARINEIIKGLVYKKVCAQWVPHQLKLEIKTARLEASQWILSRYRSEGNDFLYTAMRD